MTSAENRRFGAFKFEKISAGGYPPTRLLPLALKITPPVTKDLPMALIN